MPGTPASIFISYSRRNSSFVDKLEADLRIRHLSTWVDRRNVESTLPWKRVLQDAIDQHDLVVVVLSPSSITSRLVLMECSYALRKSKPLIALEYQPCPVPPGDLQSVSRIAFHTSYRQGLSNLLLALTGVERDPSTETAPGSYLEQARQAQNAGKWRQASGYWQALLEVDPHNSETRHYLEQSLRALGGESNASGAWEQAISAWEELLKLKPDDAQATRQLQLAQQNQSFVLYYEDARQFIRENQLSPASTQLRLLWQYTPYYGDPEGLALKAGVTKPLRSPATLDSEEEAKLAKARKDKEDAEERERAIQKQREEDEARRQQQEAEAEARRQQEKAEAEARERQRLAQLKLQQEADEARERQRLAQLKLQQEADEAREQQEREEWEAAEQIRLAELQRSPGWFMQHELGTTRVAVWSSFFFLLSGLSCTVGIVTQSVSLAFAVIAITSVVAYVLGYHRTIHRLPERLRHRAGQNELEEEAYSSDAHEARPSMVVDVIAPLAVVITGCLIAFFFVNYLSQLKYNAELTGQFLGFTRSEWLGRQLKAGLAIGAIISLILVLSFEPWKGLSDALRRVLTWGTLLSFLFSWLICALFAFIIDWGWGLGNGWDISLLGFVVGIIGGTGLASSLIVWKKSKPLF